MPTQSRPANNLILAMKDHLVIFDAPSGELQSRWGHRRGQEEISGQDLNLLLRWIGSSCQLCGEFAASNPKPH
jgi:hypothetical protein